MTSAPEPPEPADPTGKARSNRAGALLARLEELEVEVEKLVAGGEGLARFEGIPIFVPRSAPGDRLRVRLVERHPDYGRAEIVEILAPGPGRREPPCPYFERCGGCDLQHLGDALQPRLKAEAVCETLVRLGGIEIPRRLEVVTGDAWGYRLRTQLHVERVERAERVERVERVERLAEEGADHHGQGGERVRVGYHQRRSRELVAVAACPVLVPELEAVLPALPDLLAPVPVGRIDLAAGGGGAITGAPVVEGLPHGEVTLEVAGATYSYDARCFFQTHRGLVGDLVERAVGPWEGEEAYDLYAGVGLFAIGLARRYHRVVAIDGDRIAVRYCRTNARRNRSRHLEVVSRAVESWIRELPAGAGRVVVDPPRAGLARRVRQALVERPANRLTYVSCHAATLARDLRQLRRAYHIESLTLLDLFPQTGHMEAVVQLTAG